MKKGEVIAVSISKKKGQKKQNMPFVRLNENYGIIGDAHAGNWHRQVSLLAQESIEKLKKKGLGLKAGDFAENITTRGINLLNLPIGTKLKIGEDVILEITQIGKECHQPCNIFYQIGDCIMPKEGIFAKVLKGGIIKPGDTIILTPKYYILYTKY
jgi:MOSC domain-containing protein YiiM